MKLEEAERLVATNVNYSWDGWTLIEFKPDAEAIYHPEGTIRRGTWGFIRRHSVTGLA